MGSHSVTSRSSLHHRQHSYHHGDDDNYLNTGLWVDVAQDYVNIRDADASGSYPDRGEKGQDSSPKLAIPPVNLLEVSPDQVKTQKKVMNELRDSLRRKQNPSVVESDDNNDNKVTISQESSSVYVDIHSSEEEDESFNDQYENTKNLTVSPKSNVKRSTVNNDYINNDFAKSKLQPQPLISQVPILKKGSIKDKVQESPMYAELNNVLKVHQPIYQTLNINTNKSPDSSSLKDNDYINIVKPPPTIKEIKANKANVAPMLSPMMSELNQRITKPTMNKGDSKDNDYINVVKPPPTIKEIKANKAKEAPMLSPII